MLDAIVSISLFLLGYWYWQEAQYCKTLALQATKARCYTLGLIMLDDYVALNRITLKKDVAGHWRICRCYTFEFASTGEQRYRGLCTLLGHYVQSIEMDAYRIETSPLD